MEIADILSPFEGESFLRIALAVVLGGAVGLEREFSGRAAGLRTHILVCLGATIIVLASTAVPRLYGNAYQETLRIDPGRIAAGIVTGIGFLGAGAIIRTGEFVRGLTTAACIWFAAALGIVIGEGFYLLAISSTVVVVLVLRVDEAVEGRIKSPVYRALIARIRSTNARGFETACRDVLKQKSMRIQDMDCAFDREGDFMEIKVYLKTRNPMDSREVVGELKDFPGLISIRWQS